MTSAYPLWYCTEVLDPYKSGTMQQLFFSSEDSGAASSIFMVLHDSRKYLLRTVNLPLSDPAILAAQAKQELDSALELSQQCPEIAKPLNMKTKEDKDNSLFCIETLYDFSGETLDESAKLSLMQVVRRTLEPLVFFSRKSIHHVDIKPSSILLTPSGELRILDLGFSRNLFRASDQAKKLPSSTGSPAWDPELYAPPLSTASVPMTTEAAAEKSDVYAWGMSMYQLIAQLNATQLGKERREAGTEFGKKIAAKKESDPESVKLFRWVLARVLSEDPSQRPTFEALQEMFGKTVQGKPGEAEEELRETVKRKDEEIVQLKEKVATLKAVLGVEWKRIQNVLPPHTEEEEEQKRAESELVREGLPVDIAPAKVSQSVVVDQAPRKEKFTTPQKTGSPTMAFSGPIISTRCTRSPEKPAGGMSEIVVVTQPKGQDGAKSCYVPAVGMPSPLRTGVRTVAGGEQHAEAEKLIATFSFGLREKIREAYYDIANSAKTDVDLSCEKLGDLGARIIALALRRSTKIQSLNLGGCDIGPIGGAAIGESLKGQPSLRELELGPFFWHFENHVGDQGAMAIAVGIKQNSVLESLSLAYNGITDRGMKELATASGENSGLKTLALGNNEVRDKSGKSYGFRAGIDVTF